jgi:hypothetical protein
MLGGICGNLPMGMHRRGKTRWVVDIKKPRLLFPRDGANYWRRPTFAQPIEALSSGLQRFTSVFGMGTGGATALGSPESSGEIDRAYFKSANRFEKAE